MRLNRVHVEVPVGGRAQVLLDGTAANHIARVLRLREGDPLILFDDAGGEHAAVVATVTRDGVRVTVGKYSAIDRESPLRVTLAQGISRGERMDVVVQKATELGVQRIVPLLPSARWCGWTRRRPPSDCATGAPSPWPRVNSAGAIACRKSPRR